MVGDGGSMLLSGGQAVEAAKQVYTNITNGDGLTWKNAVDVITLGISVSGMGMAGASIAKSGKSLKAMYKGEKAISNVATSNATKGVSQARETSGPMKMDLQMFGGKSGSGSVIKKIQSKSPQQLIADGWEDVTNPKMAANTTSREFFDPKSGLKIRFDKGVDGANGFEAVDHYHVMNPNYTNKKVDYYFDIDGKPVGKGAKASHIVIKGGE